MSAPDHPGPPWRSSKEGPDPVAKQLGPLLEEARSLRPSTPTEMERAWRGLERRFEGGGAPRRWLAGPALALSTGLVVAAAAVGLWVHRRASPQVVLAGIGRLKLSRDAQYRVEPGRAGTAQRVFLTRGSLLAQIDHQPFAESVVIEAPQLEVVVVGTRFQIIVEPARSRVEVLDGRVRAGHPGGASVLLSAGEALGSDDPRLDPLPPARLDSSPRVAVPKCETLGSLEERRACYQASASGSGLATQNALYALAQFERDDAHAPGAALESLREYQRRFPQGMFAPEAALAELDVLLQLRQSDPALARAQSFLSGYPTNPRRDSVKLVEAHLLRQERHDLRQALALYRDLARSATRTDVIEEALFESGVCEEALGDPAAQATFGAYQGRFPQGPHAGDVAAHLHP